MCAILAACACLEDQVWGITSVSEDLFCSLHSGSGRFREFPRMRGHATRRSRRRRHRQGPCSFQAVSEATGLDENKRSFAADALARIGAKMRHCDRRQKRLKLRGAQYVAADAKVRLFGI